MSFIIDPKSTSFNQIKRDLKIWAQNLPNYNSFRTFYEDEAGDIIMDMLAGFSAYIAYNDLSATEENYLLYLKARESAIAITSNVSYNAFRGQNNYIQIRVVPTETVSLHKYEGCGFVNGVAISPIQDYTLLAGQPITIKLVIGDIEEEEITIQNNRLNVFRFVEPKVSADLKLLLNSVEVPVSTNVLDLVNDFYYVQSNTYGSVDVQYLNDTILTPANPYNTGDVITLHYIKLMNISFIFPNDVEFDYGIIDELSPDTTIFSVYKAPESTESIQINGPLYNETRKTIRARKDYPKSFKQLNSDFIDTNSRDVNLPVIYLTQKRVIPAFLDVTYIKSDNTLLNNTERAALYNSLNSSGTRAHNIPQTEIIDPKKIDVRLTLRLTKKLNTDNSNYINNILNIFRYYKSERGFNLNRQQKLEFEFDLKQLEFDLERLNYVQIARVDIFTKVWSASTNFKRGEFLVSTIANGYMYEVISETYNPSKVNIGLNSSLVEPSWSTTQDEFVYESISPWSASTVYTAGTIVKSATSSNLLYRVLTIKNTNTSGLIEPIWGTILNELIEDNDITWQVISPYEVTDKLIYKTHALSSFKFKCDWNEYYIFNYGTGVIWE